MDGKKLTTVWKLKFLNFKDRAKEKLHDAADFVKENPEVAAGAATLGTIGLKMIHGAIRNKREDDHRTKQVWDPVNGFWLDTRRKLTNSEKETLGRLRKEGKSTAEALKDMHLLK